MQHCNNCKVSVRGNKSECPLCGNTLSEKDRGELNMGKDSNANTEMDLNGDVAMDMNADPEMEIFPNIPPSMKYYLAKRIMIFITVVSIVLSLVIYVMFPTELHWPLFVIFGLGSMWLSIIVVARKKHNITKNIMRQVLVASLLSVSWDWGTGWKGWSLDYVLPVLYISAIVVMYVTARILNLRARDYIAYFFLDGLFGILPVLFILFRWVNVIVPSLISAAVSVIFLSAILIFQWDKIKEDLEKRMHI